MTDIYADEKSNLQEFFTFIEEDMEAIDRGGNTYEIVQKGYSKGTACDVILKKFGMELDQAYVFGDSMNDLSVIRQIKRCLFRQIKTGLSEHLTME